MNQILSQNELAILDYINKNSANVAKMNIQELANAVFVSTATIIRLCKKLSLSGFNELKYGLRQSLSEYNLVDTSLDLKGILSGNLSVLRQMTKDISVSQVEQVIDLLCNDGSVFLFARGLTYMPMNYMYNMLLSVDRECILYLDPPLMYHAALQMKPGDLVLISSSGGVTNEVLKAATMIKNSGAYLAVLSSSKETPLREMANAFFLCPAPKRRFHEVDINSRMPIAFMTELILDGYFSRLNLNPPSDPKVYVDLKNW